MSNTPSQPPMKRERLDHFRDRGLSVPGRLTNLPIIEDRYDRYCASCNFVMESSALEKYPGQRCSSCKALVEYRCDADGLWRRCVRCDVFLRCTFKYCHICGRSNQHFDVGKVEEKEARLKEYYFELFKKEQEEELLLTSQADKLEASQVSNVEKVESKECGNELDPSQESADSQANSKG